MGQGEGQALPGLGSPTNSADEAYLELSKEQHLPVIGQMLKNIPASFFYEDKAAMGLVNLNLFFRKTGKTPKTMTTGTAGSTISR